MNLWHVPSIHPPVVYSAGYLVHLDTVSTETLGTTSPTNCDASLEELEPPCVALTD